MKWMYLVSDHEAMLSALGEKGWELVSVLQRGEKVRFYFKKPVLRLDERITEQQRKEVYKELGLEGKI